MKPRLIGAFLLAGIVPLLIVVALIVSRAEDQLMGEAFAKLSAVQSIKRDRVKSYFEKCVEDIEVACVSGDAQRLFSEIKAYHDRMNVGPADPYPITAEYREIHAKNDRYLRDLVETYGYHDALIICAAHGHVMYTVATEADLGENLSSGGLGKSGLGEVWRTVKETGEIHMTDMALYPPSNNEPAMFVGAPLEDENGVVIGVLVLQLKASNLNAIMQERTGMGQSGETYLVGPDRLMRSDSYLDPEGHSVQASLSGTLQENGVDTEAAVDALAGQEGIGIIVDYNGHAVLSCYSPLDLPGGIRWAVIAEIDEAEVERPVILLRRTALTIGLALAVLVALFAFWMAVNISRPVEAVTGIAKNIALGNLDTEVTIRRKDEIGLLADAFRAMTDSLRAKAELAGEVARGKVTGEVRVASEKDVLGQAMRKMVDGLKDKTRAAQAIARGDLEAGMVEATDEDVLAGAMAEMVKSLKAMYSEVLLQSRRILENDLRARTDTTKFGGDYRKLMEGINDLSDQFASQTKKSIKVIEESLQDLTVSSREVSTTSNQQAAAVKEILSTMEDSDKLAKGILEKINEVVRISKKTREDVKDGFTIIKSSLEKMNQINVTNDSTIEGIKLLNQQIVSIWEIVGMINSIADQTKIIAFNAELEAASAGEAGKNFEIVAGEIRRLADNTVASTKDIKAKIDEIQKSSDTLILSSEEGTERIREGWDLSKQLEKVFSNILGSAEISAESSEQISLSINQQVASFEQILLALKQISEGIDNFVASTGSTTQAVQGLENMVEDLNKTL